MSNLHKIMKDSWVFYEARIDATNTKQTRTPSGADTCRFEGRAYRAGTGIRCRGGGCCCTHADTSQVAHGKSKTDKKMLLKEKFLTKATRQYRHGLHSGGFETETVTLELNTMSKTFVCDFFERVHPLKICLPLCFAPQVQTRCFILFPVARSWHQPRPLQRRQGRPSSAPILVKVRELGHSSQERVRFCRESCLPTNHSGCWSALGFQFHLLKRDKYVC